MRARLSQKIQDRILPCDYAVKQATDMSAKLLQEKQQQSNICLSEASYVALGWIYSWQNRRLLCADKHASNQESKAPDRAKKKTQTKIIID